jgi:hypothetical protein
MSKLATFGIGHAFGPCCVYSEEETEAPVENVTAGEAEWVLAVADYGADM